MSDSANERFPPNYFTGFTPAVSKRLARKLQALHQDDKAKLSYEELKAAIEYAGTAINLGKHLRGEKKEFPVDLALRLAHHYNTTLGALLDVPVKSAPLRVALALSGNVAYAREIARGFRDNLQLRLLPTGRPLEFVHDDAGGDGDADPSQWEARSDRAIRAAQKGCDVFVTVGTQISQALKSRLGAEYGRRVPHLFLGVTYPAEAGLVAELTERTESYDVCGVSYGGGSDGSGVEAVARCIAKRLFPGRNLYFIYRNNISQDAAAAEKLGRLMLPEARPVRLIPTERFPSLDDLKDKDGVYFAWYLSDLMFESPECEELLRERLVVATTQKHVHQGMAVAGVSVDDRTVGQKGCELLVERLQRGDSRQLEYPFWGRRNVLSTEQHYWINEEAAQRRGITFPAHVLEDRAQFTVD